ncbi:hypothetical protein [Umezawaea beigongshangensis]|uniref:hypothetical protein n=1 Tax=Umezawaea beigongshangensis TaxID=2780383 RepID=UPI0027DB28F0|nr:hypothetical protein [Umezawaea beigongshangensis]
MIIQTPGAPSGAARRAIGCSERRAVSEGAGSKGQAGARSKDGVTGSSWESVFITIESYVAFKNSVNQSMNISAGHGPQIDALTLKPNAMKHCTV